MAARLVTGRAVVPHLFRPEGRLAPGGDVRTAGFSRLGINPRWLALVLDGMNAVVNEQGGTAYARAHHRPGDGDGRQDRAPLRSAASARPSASTAFARAPRSPGKSATTRCSSPSRRSTRRATSAPWSSSMAAKAAAAAPPSRRRSAATFSGDPEARPGAARAAARRCRECARDAVGAAPHALRSLAAAER